MTGKQIFLAEQYRYLLFYLLHYDATSPQKNSQTIYALFSSLTDSGIIDHFEGGFFNSAHNCEKSLANNATLINLFTAAAGHFFEGVFSVPAIHSAQWVINNLQSPDGAFFQTMAAENSLNNYYKLDRESVKNILDQDSFTAFASAFSIDDGPTFSTNNIIRQRSTQQIAEHALLHIKQVPLALEDAKQQIALFRKTKITPTINHTISCKSNGKTISALFNAARQFNRDDFATAAFSALQDIQQKLWSDNKLLNDDNNILEADTASYLLIIHALLKRLQYQWNDLDFHWLKQISEQFSDTAENIVKAMIKDNIDSTVDDFYNLYLLTSNQRFLTLAESIIGEVQIILKTNPEKYPQLLITLTSYLASQNFIIIRGSNYQSSHWLDQTTTGFNPSNYIYAVANSNLGFEKNSNSLIDKIHAVVRPFKSLQNKAPITYYSLDDLLADYS